MTTSESSNQHLLSWLERPVFFFALGSAHSKGAGPQMVTVQDTGQVTREGVGFLLSLVGDDRQFAAENGPDGPSRKFLWERLGEGWEGEGGW